jgi:nucleotide-binding universal stress UspA family protein
MFKNVLVGVDGRSGGRDAIALARTLVEAKAGKLTLVHVREGCANPQHAFVPGRIEEERAASARLLPHERERAELDAELVSVSALTPARGLHELAEETGADLLVVGSCARGALRRVLIGDDASAALNGAPCAIAIADAGLAERSKPLEAIGVAYNATAESEEALELARALGRASGASVRALEVVRFSSYAYGGLVAPPLLGSAIEELLEQAQERMRALEGVEGSAIYGLTGEQLAAFSEDVDLLVVGSRGYGPLRRLVAGSTSAYLERHARSALLVLPRGARREGAGRKTGRVREAIAAN